MIGLGSFFIAAALAAPSFAAKQAVSDEELDMVTAAGQPVVITVGTSGTVIFLSSTNIASVLQSGSQNALRALVLNNVTGENQVANGVNISGSNSATGVQANNINQSWGATSDVTIVSTPGLTASVSPLCLGLICKAAITVTTVGGVARRLSRAADQIIEAGASSTVVYNPQTSMQAIIEGNSQSGLVALVVNNVTGLNQVGNGLNVAGGGVSLTNAATGGVNVGAGNASAAFAGQSNALGAWRGTVQGFTRVP